jgi:hypothetical protein
MRRASLTSSLGLILLICVAFTFIAVRSFFFMQPCLCDELNSYSKEDDVTGTVKCMLMCMLDDA